MTMMMYGFKTVSLWDGLVDLFSPLITGIEMIWDFISNGIDGLRTFAAWLMNGGDFINVIIPLMPSIVTAGALATVAVLVLRQIFGFFIGGS